MKITPAETPKTDTKRRRVGHDADTSSPQRVPVTQPSTTIPASQPVAGPSKLSNGTSKVNGTDLSSANTKTAGTNGASAARLAKPTTPAVPSPLRQAWGQNDSPSPSPPQIHASKQTRAASFMTELIREATPAKKPDVSNPYQTASPVKPSKPPTKKPPPKRTRPVSQVPTEEKLELSPQAIIEATVPKVCAGNFIVYLLLIFHREARDHDHHLPCVLSILIQTRSRSHLLPQVLPHSFPRSPMGNTTLLLAAAGVSLWRL